MRQKDNIVHYSIIALGITSMLTQIILIREMLNVFYGNELVLGIILANWLLLTGAGAIAGKLSAKFKNKELLLTYLQVLIALLPIITVFLLRFLRNIVFQPGSMLSMVDIIISSFILLLPYCLVSGIMFTTFSIKLSENRGNLISKVYYLNTAGSIIGGVLFNFIFIYFLQTFHILFFIMLVNLLSAFLLSTINKNIKTVIFISVLSLLFFLQFFYDIDYISKSMEYKNQNLIEQKDTPYGNLVVTKTAEQLNFFENGYWLTSTGNIQDNEEAAHYALIQHEHPANVLLISGSVTGIAKEILKYKPDKFDLVELNPWLIELAKKYTQNLDYSKINCIIEDGRKFIREVSYKYDVVIIYLPEPATAQINRYYTLEFFRELKKKLNDNAVISLSLPPTPDYVSSEEEQMNSVIYNTLKKVFKNTIIIPGGKNYFISSDAELSYEISKRIDERHIDNIYVNKYYLDEPSIVMRADNIMQSINKNSLLNRDFRPISYYNQLLYWISYYKLNYWLLLGIFFIPFVIILIRLRSINLGLFTEGFTASASEIVLLLSFQIIYGYVYHFIGIIIMLFMLGLTLGSYYIFKNEKLIKVKNFIAIHALIIVYILLLPFILILINSPGLNTPLIFAAIFLLILIIAILTGIQFAIASKILERDNYKVTDNQSIISSIASSAYSADLFGSALGAVAVSGLLIPLFGIMSVCIITGILNLISGFVIFVKRKRYI